MKIEIEIDLLKVNYKSIFMELDQTGYRIGRHYPTQNIAHTFKDNKQPLL